MSESQVSKVYNQELERRKEKFQEKKTSAVATMATILDTAAAGLNGLYAIGGDVISAVCGACELAVLAGYQYFSVLPNLVSSLSMLLWIGDGIDTGENSYSVYSNGTSTTTTVSVSQDTIVAVATNIAGWTILREPNVAFGVDAAVAGYDFGRLGVIPGVDIAIPSWINPTLSYNTNTGLHFSW